ncbi:hypothetical protein GGF31_007290 [Allomyces arbusculus]|nr:hypothetical protein GGF31_007290 [Allomyces arbusculus]
MIGAPPPRKGASKPAYGRGENKKPAYGGKSTGSASSSSGKHRQLCEFIKKGKKCYRGASCPFFHPPGSDRTKGADKGGKGGKDVRPAPSASSRSGGGRSDRLCNEFLRGGCPHGDDCRFSHGHHDDVKIVAATAVCPHLTKSGGCRDTAKCKYDHPSMGTAQHEVTITRSVRIALQSNNFAQSIEQLYCTQPIGMNPQKVLDVPNFYATGSSSESEIVHVLAACMTGLQESPSTYLAALVARKPLLDLFRQLLGDVKYSLEAQRPLHSFQRVLVPLVIMLAHSAMESAALDYAVATAYAMVRDQLDVFLPAYLGHVEACLIARSVADPRTTMAQVLARKLCTLVPLSFTQLLAPLIKCLEILFRRSPMVTHTTTVVQGIAKLDHLISQCTDLVAAGSLPTLDTPEAMTTLATMLTRTKRHMQATQSLEERMATKRREEQELRRRPRPENEDELIWIDNKVAAPKGKGQHDNDKADFRALSIVPTMGEILATAKPVLPGNWAWHPHAHWLPAGPDRLLDTHFRLLRQDMLAAFKASLGILLKDLAEKPIWVSGRYKKVVEFVEADLMLYTRVHKVRYEFNERGGLTLCVRLQLPPVAVKGDLMAFWDKCLRRDGLVAVIVPVDSIAATNGVPFRVVFATIAEVDPHTMRQPGKGGTAVIKLAWSAGATDASLFGNVASGQPAYLVESRALMFEAYRPILSALQAKQAHDMPFQDILCPATAPTAPIRASPPRYTQRPGFAFDLSFLTKSATPLPFVPTDTTSHAQVRRDLVVQSTLDASQASALLGALSSEVCCIQGPPGTGKSFLGVKFVEAVHKLNDPTLFPIVVICYTNHALDTFLTDLITAGIKSIVRVGSKPNEALEKYRINLWSSDEFIGRLKDVEREMYKTGRDLQALLDHEPGDITSRGGGVLLREYFNMQMAAIVRVGREKKLPDNWVRSWLTGADIELARIERNDKILQQISRNRFEMLDAEAVAKQFPDPETNLVKKSMPQELLQVKDVWTLSLTSRRILADHMAKKVAKEHPSLVASLQERFAMFQDQLQQLRESRKYEATRMKKVIGLTTTGAAKHQNLLRALRPRIIVCEEAGEVLEAHVLASLSPSVEHLVLIGDHQQLRPGINEYELSVENKRGGGTRYRLDLSLFERLITDGKLHHFTLQAQRRMKPVIAQFIRETLYHQLQDGDNTFGRPPVRGMVKDVFFLAHDHPQDSREDAYSSSMSHSNAFEVEMIVALVQYMLRQGYAPNQLVVLTPYVGQLIQIRAALEKKHMALVVGERDQELIDRVDDTFGADGEAKPSRPARKAGDVTDQQLNQCIRVSSIDNYQGEEADIVLLSLVRSTFAKGNDRGIGFLRIDNRINVMLSRARQGMYLVGNAALLEAKSQLWHKVLDMMHAQELVGPALPISCQHHLYDVRYVASAQDLAEKAPDGGCLLPCKSRLPCGHMCPKKCHADDPEHKLGKCFKPCIVLHDPCGHECPKPCWQSCGRCEVTVGPVVLPQCGHTLERPLCFQAHDPRSVLCMVEVAKTRFCGHKVVVPCYASADEQPCPTPCNSDLSCGHACRHPCDKCTTRNEITNSVETRHLKCTVLCDQMLTECRHTCGVECCKHGAACPPCSRPCAKTKCDHGPCTAKCSDPCEPCLKPCTWSCEHLKCMWPCGAPCVRLPCDRKCDRTLACLHPCPGICSESCPPWCQACAPVKVRATCVDPTTGATFAEIDPARTPVVVLRCGHVLTMQALDALVGLDDVYEQVDGKWIGVKPYSFFLDASPTCPTCSMEIDLAEFKRYGRLEKASALIASDKGLLQKLEIKLEAVVQQWNTLKRALTEQTIEKSKPIRDAFTAIISQLHESPVYRLRTAPLSLGKKKNGKAAVDPIPPSFLILEGQILVYLAEYHRSRIAAMNILGQPRLQPALNRPAEFAAADAACTAAIALFQQANAPLRERHARIEQLLLIRAVLKKRVAVPMPLADKRDWGETTVDVLATRGSVLVRETQALAARAPAPEFLAVLTHFAAYFVEVLDVPKMSVAVFELRRGRLEKLELDSLAQRTPSWVTAGSVRVWFRCPRKHKFLCYPAAVASAVSCVVCGQTAKEWRE